MSKSPSNPEYSHRFGGDWTDKKLQILQDYMKAYTQVLKKTSLSVGYIDAFAGTGTRSPRTNNKQLEIDPEQSRLFDGFAEKEQVSLLDGSARIALSTDPSFNGFIFIDKSKKHCDELENLKKDFPEKSISIRCGDANEEIRKICKINWKGRRAVLFLDPYGGQVEWDTIKAVAETKAIDLWLLFPLGAVVSRLLKRSGDIPDSWRKRLNVLLGTEDWYDEIYKVEKTPTLFGGELEHLRKASIETIGHRFNERLSSIFSGVAKNPKVLVNSKNCPLYLFCFAVGNSKGAPVALRIAQHLLDKVSI